MKKENKKKVNQLGLLIQMILLFMLIYFLILKLLMPEFQKIVDYILAFSLIMMAINNYKIYKRKKMTVIYGVIGIVLLVLAILGV